MANRHINMWSMSLITREMQIKTTMRDHLALDRVAIINKSRSDGEDVEKGELFCIDGGNTVWGSHCGKQHGDTSKIKNGFAF